MTDHDHDWIDEEKKNDLDAMSLEKDLWIMVIPLLAIVIVIITVAILVLRWVN